MTCLAYLCIAVITMTNCHNSWSKRNRDDNTILRSRTTYGVLELVITTDRNLTQADAKGSKICPSSRPV
jgi:hypothetical protein